MRSLVSLLIFTFLLADNNPQWARIVIPVAEVSSFIQPIKFDYESNSWIEPNHINAWQLEHNNSWLQAIYMHRDGLGSQLPLLKQGDIIYLYEDLIFEKEPLQLHVIEKEIILSQDEFLVWDKAQGDTFALITCHPENDPEAPERLIVWTKVDYGPRKAYVQWGDTLFQIARRYNVSAIRLIEANSKIKNPDLIFAGDWLLVP